MSGKETNTYMDQDAKARVMSAAAGDVQKGSYQARMQSSADKNVNMGKVPPSGKK